MAIAPQHAKPFRVPRPSGHHLDVRLPSPLVLAMLLGLVTSRVSAQGEQTATLALDIPSELTTCPSERVIRRTVAAHLGWDPFRDESDLHIVASLARDADGLVARVQAFEADGTSIGERELHSASNDCAELARAMSLAISVAVDPFILTRAGTEAPELSAEPEPAPVLEPQPPPEPERGGATEPGPSVESGVDPGSGTGGTTAFGGAIGASIHEISSFRPFITAFVERQSRHFSIMASLRYLTPASADGPSGGRAVAHSIGVGLAACFVHRGLGVCGLGDVDLLLAHGAGVADSQFASRLIPRLGARVSADFDGGLPHFVVRPFADIRFALVRPDLVVNHESAFTVPIVSVSAGLMLGWRSP